MRERKTLSKPSEREKIAKTTFFFHTDSVICYICLLPKILEACRICEILVDSNILNPSMFVCLFFPLGN